MFPIPSDVGKLSADICGVSCVQNVVQSACHKKQARLIKEILQYAQKSVYNHMRGEQHGVRGRFSNSWLGMRRINVERSTELGRRFDKGQLLTLRYLRTKGAFINPNPKAARRFVFQILKTEAPWSSSVFVLKLLSAVFMEGFK